MTMKSNKWLYWSCKILLVIWFLPAAFYLSLSLESFLQIRKAEQFEYQYIPFSDGDNLYSFRKNLYFTPEIANYLSDGGRIYLYFRKDAVDIQKIQNIQIEVIRTNHGFHSIAFPNVKLHIDYNEIQVRIRGIKLNNPPEDIKVLLAFSGIKRRIKFWTYLFLGLSSAFGWGILFTFYSLSRRKQINRRNLAEW